MFKILGIVLFAFGLHSCSSSNVNAINFTPNILNSKESENGWQLLFDGKSTNGWHTYGYNSVGKGWVVTDGTLHLDPSTKSDWPANESKDILTNEEYENFHFKTDWKVAPNGNSGIIFFVHEDKAQYKNTYETGMEMQVLDNAGHPDAKITKHRAGDLYDLISSSTEPVKLAGEWNTAEIIANKGKLDFYLNGKHIINTTMWDTNWKQMIAGSKFKSMPAFGTFTKGKIALQEHGDEVWYRNVKIKKL